mgnify:CR=1 FL=1
MWEPTQLACRRFPQSTLDSVLPPLQGDLRGRLREVPLQDNTVISSRRYLVGPHVLGKSYVFPYGLKQKNFLWLTLKHIILADNPPTLGGGIGSLVNAVFLPYYRFLAQFWPLAHVFIAYCTYNSRFYVPLFLFLPFRTWRFKNNNTIFVF